MPAIVRKLPEYGAFYVLDGDFSHRVKDMFHHHPGFSGEAARPEDAQVIVWTGGTDINPSMYKQVPIPGITWDTKRDTIEAKIFLDNPEAYKIGICRGAQFLNVLNGGSMWQDINYHNDGGVHEVLDVITGEHLMLNSLHHQQMRPPLTYGEVIAYAAISDAKRDDCGSIYIGRAGPIPLYQKQDATGMDVEAIWYGKTSSLCFQPHPEFKDKTTREYFFNLLERYMPPF